MQDPIQENIEGRKQVAHTVEHRINWGYVALGVAGIVAMWVVYQSITAGNDPKNEDTGLSTEV